MQEITFQEYEVAYYIYDPTDTILDGHFDLIALANAIYEKIDF